MSIRAGVNQRPVHSRLMPKGGLGRPPFPFFFTTFAAAFQQKVGDGAEAVNFFALRQSSS